MRLIDLLSRDRIVVPLKGRTLVNAATELTNALIASGAVPQPDKADRLLDADSLPKDVVPVGSEAFMLHFRTDAVTANAVALGVSPQPVYREQDSTREARIVVLILAPLGEAGALEYLQVQGAFASAFSIPEIVDGILAAKKPEDVLALAPLADIVLPNNLSVRDVMAREVVSVGVDQTLGEAAKLMAGGDVPAVPVVNDAKEVVGLVTYRELLSFMLPAYVKRISGEFQAVGKSAVKKIPPKDPQTLKVKAIMDRTVLCVSEDDTLAEVASIMVNKDVDRFPVVRDGVLVGFITRGDIVRRVLGG
ncbi:MAG: CBS domain-containing protein [Gemmatimonadetes bacterium]|nr:CBS domain-containing protein [Gemmatimonadota bacterium]